MKSAEEGSAFDNWYNGLVGFHFNSERMLVELNLELAQEQVLRRWMVVCWNNAIDAAQNAFIDQDDCDISWLKEKT